MKKSFAIILVVIATCLIQSCDDYFNPEPGKDYDIKWPVPHVELTMESMTVDTEYTLQGEHLDKVFQVFLGSDQAEIIDTLPGRITFRTPRLFDRSNLTLRNYYDYSYTSQLQIRPSYLPVTITNWPGSFRRTQSITLEGENVDQLEVVIIGNTRIPVNGRIIDDKTYRRIILSLAEVTIDPDLNKVLLKAMGLDGSYLEAPDSTTIN